MSLRVFFGDAIHGRDFGVEFAGFDLPTLKLKHKTRGKYILSAPRTYANTTYYEQRK
jgi:hypothetical protein